MTESPILPSETSDIRSLKKMSSALRQVLPTAPRAFRTKKATLGFEIDPLDILRMVFSGDTSGIKVRQEVIQDEFDPHRDDFEERQRESYRAAQRQKAREEEEDDDEAYEERAKASEKQEGAGPASEASDENKIEIEEKTIVRVEMLPPMNPTFEIHYPTLYRITFKKYRPIYFQIHTLEDNEEDFMQMVSASRSGMLFLGMNLDYVENEDFYDGDAKRKKRKKQAHEFSKPNRRYRSMYNEMFDFYQIGLYVGTEEMLISNVVDEPNMFMYCDLFDVKDFSLDALLNLKREELCALLTMRVHNLKLLLAKEEIEPADHNEMIFQDVVMAVLFFQPRTFTQRRKVVQTLHRAGFTARELTDYLNCITKIEVAENTSLTVRIKGEPSEEETDQNQRFMEAFKTDPRWDKYLADKKANKTRKKKTAIKIKEEK